MMAQFQVQNCFLIPVHTMHIGKIGTFMVGA